MKGNLTYYFILNPLIIFLVYALSPILFHKEKYINMKDERCTRNTYSLLCTN
ncbi:Uncharacterised protein [Streptococcus pneumoniae]|nr:Uncharacterised protein [Streptococcus pneumoniae]CKG51120.1 Uncharacterised protein [Streptococcus pneumoniae]